MHWLEPIIRDQFSECARTHQRPKKKQMKKKYCDDVTISSRCLEPSINWNRSIQWWFLLTKWKQYAPKNGSMLVTKLISRIDFGDMMTAMITHSINDVIQFHPFCSRFQFQWCMCNCTLIRIDWILCSQQIIIVIRLVLMPSEKKKRTYVTVSHSKKKRKKKQRKCKNSTMNEKDVQIKTASFPLCRWRLRS